MFFKNKSHDENFKRLEEQLQALAEAVSSGNRRLDGLHQTVSSLESLTQTDVLPDTGQTDAVVQVSAQLDALIRTVTRLDALIQSSAHPESLPNADQTDTLNQVSAQLDALVQTVTHLEDSLNQDISRLQTDIHKHDMAVEDLLDEWEDKKSDEAAIQDKLQESAQTESVLLQLFEAYQEQFWNLKHFTEANDSSYSGQIALMEETLEQYRRTCHISMIQDCGVSVNYELHEVIDAVETSDPALDKTVAGIYRCGYLYKGTVKKKAQVSAYRLSKQHS